MEALQWAACLILGVPSALLIPLNWLSFAGWVIAVRRGHKGGHSFAPPFLCGIAGAVALLVCPWPGAGRWAWLPPLLDLSILLLLASPVLHGVARLTGCSREWHSREWQMTRESPTVLNCPSADEAAFRRAIDADPDNDTIRLIFADWLEERGDPRAAAIRKRCEQVRRIKEKCPRLKNADSRLSYWAAHSHQYQLQPPLPAATLRALERRYGVHFPEDYFDFVVRIAEGGAGPSYGIESIQKVCWDGMAQPFPFDGTADPSSAYDLPDDTGRILLAQHGCASDAFLVVSGSEAGMVWEFWGGGDCLWHPMGMTFLAWYESWLDEGLRLAQAGKGAALWRVDGW